MTKYLFCVDSDGCVMDTMTYKHQQFFGPLAAKIFEIPKQETQRFLKSWNQINLYSKTRGVNRFVGLLMTLKAHKIKGIQRLDTWVQTTPEFSERALAHEIDKYQTDDLKKALQWSKEVNAGIHQTKGLDRPFENALAGLKALKKYGKVAVVSSANRDAIEAEWERHGLLVAVDELWCQDRGKKAEIIRQLKLEGYPEQNTLMIGDAAGDLTAAEQNNVHFYPILVGHEARSWQELQEVFLPRFLVHQSSELEANYLTKFWNNLDQTK